MTTLRILGLGCCACLTLPAVCFLYAALVAEMPPGAALEALVAQYAGRPNLTVATLLGLVPLALLAAVLGILRWLRPAGPNRPLYALAGLLPILPIIGWIHTGFWRLFLPERQPPGFPHGIEFVVGPMIYAPIGVLLSLVVAGLVQRLTRADS